MSPVDAAPFAFPMQPQERVRMPDLGNLFSGRSPASIAVIALALAAIGCGAGATEEWASWRGPSVEQLAELVTANRM